MPAIRTKTKGGNTLYWTNSVDGSSWSPNRRDAHDYPCMNAAADALRLEPFRTLVRIGHVVEVV